MSEQDRQDIRDLWSKVNTLSSQIAIQATLLAEIKVLLTERCEARLHRIEESEEQVCSIGQRVARVEHSLAAIHVKLAGIAAAGSIVGGAAVSWAFRAFGGG